MASLFLRPLFRPQALGVGLGISLTTFHVGQQRPMRLDSGPRLLAGSYGRNTQTPVLWNGQLDPVAVKQISSGSVLGLCAGLLVSTFSTSLALLIGLLVVGGQWASSHGILVIPYNHVQKYLTSINLRSAVEDKVAFKLSFGTTFALAAFMHF